MTIALAAALGLVVGLAVARVLWTETKYLRRVEGPIDAWAVHAAAERAAKHIVGLAGAVHRERVESAVRAVVVIGLPHAFIAGRPWEHGTTTMALSADRARAWVLAERDGLDARVARAVAEVAHHAIFQRAAETPSPWMRAATEWAA